MKKTAIRDRGKIDPLLRKQKARFFLDQRLLKLIQERFSRFQRFLLVGLGVLVISFLILGVWYTFKTIALNSPANDPPIGGGAFSIQGSAPSGVLSLSSASSTLASSFTKTWTTNSDFVAATSSVPADFSLGIWRINDRLSLVPVYGSGDDGAVTFSVNTDLNTTNKISGRSCADGGDAVSYSVVGLTANTATLAVTPSAGCLAVGDEVILINLQGTPNYYSNVGNYEFLRIKKINGKVITFYTNKTKYYGDGVSDDTNLGTSSTNQRVILQRVPNYSAVMVIPGEVLTANAWNGVTGGVLAFRTAGTVSVSGSISMLGKGYRGFSTPNNGGIPGEAYCSVSGGGRGGNSSGNGQNGVCGGGGGASGANENNPGGVGGSGSLIGGAGGGGGASWNPNTTASGGGGGGGYGSVGGGAPMAGKSGSGSTSGDGGRDYANWRAGGGGGGGTYGDNSLTKIFFGSGGGGGGGGSNGGKAGGSGGSGGGIIFIAGQTINLNSGGSIDASGANGKDDGDGLYNFPPGGGGGGAGGSIKLLGQIINLGTNQVISRGGAGGTNTQGWNANNFLMGAGGGVGRIAVGASTVSGSTDPSYTTIPSPIYPTGEQIWLSEVLEFGQGKKFKPDILRVSWILDGTDNIPPKIQLQGSDSPNFAGEQTCYPNGCNSYWQDGTVYDIDNETNLNISSQVTTSFVYWRLKIILDTGVNTNDTPSINDVTISTTQQINFTGILGISEVPEYILDVVSAGGNTARFGSTSNDVLVIGGGAGKLTVGTIDPVYEINGVKYATYVPGMVGQKEEVSGVIKLQPSQNNRVYQYILDFNQQEIGSDLWLFRQITDFSGKDKLILGGEENWNNLTVILSANFEGELWYEVEPQKNRLIIFGLPHNLTLTKQITPVNFEISYRLTAPRFNWWRGENVLIDSSVKSFLKPSG